MGAIKTEFESLPKEGAKDARAAYAAAFSDLQRLGLPVPTGKKAEEITRDELQGHLQEVAGELLGRYLAADPEGEIAAAKSDEEIAAKVSARLGDVWGGVPYTPNAVSADDVAAARLMGG